MKRLLFFAASFIVTSVLCSCSLFHEHEYGVWQTESAPDCVNEGVDARYCECGEKEIRSIAALGHTEKVINGFAPSCSKTGLTDGKYCTVCRVTTVEQEKIAKAPHKEVTDYGRPATCKDEGLSDGKHCDTCGKVTVSRKLIPKLPHNEIIVAEIPATCLKEGKTAGSVCSECGLVFAGIEVIPKIAHSIVIDRALPATCTSDGISEGSHCSACGEVLVPQLKVLKFSHAEVVPTCTRWGATYKGKCELCNETLARQTFLIPKGHDYKNGYCDNCGCKEIDFSDVMLYSSDEGYKYLATLENGQGMQYLYDQLKEQAIKFHNSSDKPPFHKNHNTLGKVYRVATARFDNYSFELKELSTVVELFVQDHPAFYWVGHTFFYSQSYLTLVTNEEYSDPAVRRSLNAEMYDKIKVYYNKICGETSAYNVALFYFDTIAKDNEYAYDENGEPNDADWAHSVIGAIQHGEFVCEGYSELFRMLLNLSNIENYYVQSDGEEVNHAWNLVRLDDGNYYSVDVTWADTTYKDAINYRYFAAIDADSEHFSQISRDKLGWRTVVDLPNRATSSFKSSDILEIGEEFKIGNSVYKRSSSNGVKFVRGDRITESKLVYNGVVYDIER